MQSRTVCWSWPTMGLSDFLFVSLFWSLYCVSTEGSICRPKRYPTGIVCVCNSSFCDSVPSVEPLSTKEIAAFTSGASGLRFERGILKWTRNPKPVDDEVDITLNPGAQFQSILGFGGAFTDAAGMNIANLSPTTQRRLLDAYFGEKGENLSFMFFFGNFWNGLSIFKG